MGKRLVSILLCLVFLLSMALPVYADEAENREEIKIASLEEFLEFAEHCRMDSYSQNLSVSLEADIDLGGTEFESIPIFSGSFEGNGHTVSGLSITANGSNQGLFRYLTATAQVRNLHVKGDVCPGGSRAHVGGIAGENSGVIQGCSFTGSVSGGDSVGGIAGSNGVTGVIEDCRMEGELHGSHFVGGIAGENSGVIRTCVNTARINTTAQQNSVEISDITLDTMTNSEAVNTVTDIGGIAGTSSGVIRSCENRGDVGYRQMGYNIGGIAGTQSGYITDCRNYGDIQGRKEVGGIAGQMEPASLIEYTEDTMQILQGQMGTMSDLVNRVSGNAQANANHISAQISVLRDQAQTAQDALDTLFPDEENPELPDMDTILAAQNTLSTTISAMPTTLNSIASAAQTTVSGLGRDLQAISGQLGIMGQTLNGASETLGGSISDSSDADTPDNLTGKVELCVNYGSVLADLNAGGISGAMAVENDLDILEDWQQTGEDSLNFESKLRAVILGCENQGTVTGKKQNAGGIVGWQSMGLVKGCINTGKLDGSAADYVGGISGLSTGFIRFSSAKCEIYGSAYVGGIAGSATIATDSHSMVMIRDGSEKLGAILGNAGESDTEEEEPICGNFYLAVSEDPGAIDGISYAGFAEPLALDAFLALEGLPRQFGTVAVRFLFGDGTEQVIDLAPGEALAAEQIPQIPEKQGYTGRWEGLAQAELSNILFDMTFEAVYTAHSPTIQSEKTRENGLPILLVQGGFTGEATVTVEQSGEMPQTAKGETLGEVWSVAVSESGDVTGARFLLPENTDAQVLKLLVRSESGRWDAREFKADGSYIAFSWSENDTHLALVQTQSMGWIWIAAGAGAVAVILLAVLLSKGKKKPKAEEKPA